MSTVKVVDLNEEVKEEPPIEEAPDEEQQQPEIINEVDEGTNEEHKEEAKKEANEEVKPTPKPKAKPKPSDIVQCPDCSRSMTYKNLRYSHKCFPEPPPVKKQANPKGKAKTKPKQPPKPPPEVYYSDSEEEDKENRPLSKPVRNQILKPQPVNPATALAQQYQILQQQMMQQKQERYNKICQGMFAPRMKKR